MAAPMDVSAPAGGLLTQRQETPEKPHEEKKQQKAKRGRQEAPTYCWQAAANSEMMMVRRKRTDSMASMSSMVSMASDDSADAKQPRCELSLPRDSGETPPSVIEDSRFYSVTPYCGEHALTNPGFYDPDPCNYMLY
eukprot:TRINITY_DN122796_c0_g1_i1.p2 TRINITY_DN122796_c0_g1~~TRINITY_DN122796_c0_g1_i1.p2  ORF type:complete len:137 (+),score=24.86 TRINITY_DN122796_c0_g1_i1:89-499(+)